MRVRRGRATHRDAVGSGLFLSGRHLRVEQTMDAIGRLDPARVSMVERFTLLKPPVESLCEGATTRVLNRLLPIAVA